MKMHIVVDEYMMTAEAFVAIEDARKYTAKLLRDYRKRGFKATKIGTWWDVDIGYDGGRIWMDEAVVRGGAE